MVAQSSLEMRRLSPAESSWGSEAVCAKSFLKELASSRQFPEREDLLLSVWGEGSGTMVGDDKGSLFPGAPLFLLGLIPKVPRNEVLGCS